MNVATLVEKRRAQWAELEMLCDGTGSPEATARFAALYRAACADLALASAYQLPPGTVTYLHRLVGRAHSRLYRSHRFDPMTWFDVIFVTAPRQIFADPCVRIATLLFFALFSLSAYLAYNETAFPDYAQDIVGTAALEQMEASFEPGLNGNLSHYIGMAGFYIKHNTSIGLQCFAYGILLIPCVFILCYNAVALGASFGYMIREDTPGGETFLEFVTAHGPFELTAIALSAGAGLRLGMGLFRTEGRTRIASLKANAVQAVPIMVAAAILFFLAAFTEGFISPSPLYYPFKAGWAILSSGLLMFYFVVLGFPRQEPS
ncbi:stage II sporulation protein M [Roseimaritima sediminicola]|uniref:stage II sporulation protein M n=1 Tax=Roseimaritima sediminicola TaxID=2662066 RepID=UPI00129828D9|nr:stage II sporulation protein M [Roseimaritima sediminicola]